MDLTQKEVDYSIDKIAAESGTQNELGPMWNLVKSMLKVDPKLRATCKTLAIND